ncbi:uncharacterized protein LOC135332861 [Halichondria panicea]|uniref:uncharacterized protein LOC135332861 n=1 Tax=Halichondria panicea TaxID=6063 RepID=UPI00312B39F8
MDDLPASQDSLEPLSQETMNNLMFSLGGQSAVNGLIGNEFERIQTGEDFVSNSTSCSGDAEVQVSRTIIRTIPGHHSGVMPHWSNSQGLSQGFPPPTINGALSPTLTLMPQQQLPPITYHNGGGMEPESPLTTTSHSILTPPPSSVITYPPSTSVTPTEGTPGPSNPAASLMSRIPFPGDYEFEVIFDVEPEKKVSKTASFTYSKLTSRAYLKPRCPQTFNFSFSTPPPLNCGIRAMAIYNTPELTGQHVFCCLADSHAMQEKQQLFPSHFIRAHETKTAMYCGDGTSQPCSVVTPFTNLTQKAATVWYTVYLFPCVTSHLPHKKHVEIMFILEQHGIVLGRCLVPIRVCTSPGRDRIIDEKKVNKETAEEEGEAQSSRKRSLDDDSVTEVTHYTMPPKRPCLQLSEPKVKHVIWTNKELIPYIDVTVRMMEQVHSVPPLTTAPPDQVPTSREMYPSVEAWLDSLGFARYANIFKDKGIIKLYQVPSITEEELKLWGITTGTHCRKIIASKDSVIKRDGSLSTQSSIEQDGCSPPLFTSQSPPTHPHQIITRQLSRQLSQGSGNSGSQNSQISSSSAAAYSQSQSFEVVQIQLKKKISSSSSSGSSQNNGRR